MRPEELTPGLARQALSGAALAYFDGRLTEAALVLASAARDAGVPVLVEAERLRPGLDALLAQADYVVTSAHFPQQWTGEACLGDALLGTLARLPCRVRWVATTLGARGSVLLQRAGGGGGGGAAAAAGEPQVLDELLPRLLERAAAAAAVDSSIACVSTSGIEIRAGGAASSGGPVALRLTRAAASCKLPEAVQAARQAAAAAAAAANADACNAERYAMASGGSDSGTDGEDATALVATVTAATAARLPPSAVLDTTGAGDAFIGSMVYCLATGMPAERALLLGGVVAACKCTALGARPGLPRRTSLRADLL